MGSPGLHGRGCNYMIQRESDNSQAAEIAALKSLMEQTADHLHRKARDIERWIASYQPGMTWEEAEKAAGVRVEQRWEFDIWWDAHIVDAIQCALRPGQPGDAVEQFLTREG